MLSTIVRLGLLAAFVAAARRILAPDAAAPPRLAAPKAKSRETRRRERA